MARIVIAGCGDVGTACGLLLQQAGHSVWGLRRDVTMLPTELNPLSADLTNPDSLAVLPAAIDYVIYAAAAGGYTPARYQAAYVDGVANVLQVLQARKQPIRRFILTSSSSVYGQSDGEWIDEDTPANAQGFAADTLRAGEQLVWDSAFPATVIRFAGIYGPGRTRLLDTVKRGQARCTPGLYTNRIHRDDCAAAIVHLLQLANPAELYLGVDDVPALQCEVMSWLAAQLDVAAPSHQAQTDGPFSQTEHRVRSNKRCNNNRLRASGYHCQYPGYLQGYQALLAEYLHTEKRT